MKIVHAVMPSVAHLVAQDTPFAPPVALSRAFFPHGNAQSSKRNFLVMRRSGVGRSEATGPRGGSMCLWAFG